MKEIASYPQQAEARLEAVAVAGIGAGGILIRPDGEIAVDGEASAAPDVIQAVAGLRTPVGALCECAEDLYCAAGAEKRSPFNSHIFPYDKGLPRAIQPHFAAILLKVTDDFNPVDCREKRQHAGIYALYGSGGQAAQIHCARSAGVS